MTGKTKPLAEKKPVLLIICHHKPHMDLLNSIRVSAVRIRSNIHSMSDQDWNHINNLFRFRQDKEDLLQVAY